MGISFKSTIKADFIHCDLINISDYFVRPSISIVIGWIYSVVPVTAIVIPWLTSLIAICILVRDVMILLIL